MRKNYNGSISLTALFPHKDTSVVKYYSAKINDKGDITLTMYDIVNSAITELPTKKKITCTKNLVRMTQQTTNECWCRAVLSLKRKYKLEEQQLRQLHKEELNEKYREMILMLDSDVLESILLCHQKGKTMRAEITLICIRDELARRILLNDSSRKK